MDNMNGSTDADYSRMNMNMNSSSSNINSNEHVHDTQSNVYGNGTTSMALRPVFLGNLMPTYSTELVCEVFEREHIPVDRVDLKKGYCFLFLKDAINPEMKAKTERFVEDINGMNIHGVSHALRAEFARGDGRVKRKEEDRRHRMQPNETLFVVNFHEETTKEDDLRMLFCPYGELVRIEMKRNYAFVQFKTIEQAIKAKEEVNGGKLDQSVLTVEYTSQPRDGSDRRRPTFRRRSPPPHRSSHHRSRSRSPRQRSRSPRDRHYRSPDNYRRRPSPDRYRSARDYGGRGDSRDAGGRDYGGRGDSRDYGARGGDGRGDSRGGDGRGDSRGGDGRGDSRDYGSRGDLRGGDGRSDLRGGDGRSDFSRGDLRGGDGRGDLRGGDGRGDLRGGDARGDLRGGDARGDLRGGDYGDRAYRA